LPLSGYAFTNAEKLFETKAGTKYGNQYEK
jgi:hypothetical protein